MTTSARTVPHSTSLDRTARLAGLSYLGLAITGAVGFLVVRSELFVVGDAVETAANLVESEGLARLGIAADLATVVTQAVAALYFYKLFRAVDTFAAISLAAFGFMNCAAILTSTMFTATALDVALAGGVDDAQLLYQLSEAAWNVGGLFFGLWLIPMGWLTLRSGRMPRPLGWILIAGGVGYLVATFVTYVVPDADTLAELLPLGATVGEVWMIGFLLWKGAGDPAPDVVG